MIDEPDSDEHGLFLRDKDGTPQVIERKTGTVAAIDKKGVKPDLKGFVKTKDGRKAVPVFMKMAETYMDKAYALILLQRQLAYLLRRLRQLQLSWPASPLMKRL